MSPSSSKNSHRSKQAAKTAQRKKQSAMTKGGSKTASFQTRLQGARDLEQSGKIEEAITAFQPLLSIKPNDVELHEELASLYLQTGQPEPAAACFRTAISLCPNTGFEKYAQLAQILANTPEALSFARRGVELILAETNVLSSVVAGGNTERVGELREYEASAQCAVAEIALAIIEDSNDPAVASAMDGEVEQAVMAALAASDAGSPSEIEANLSLANLRLSQARQTEARAAMTRILQHMASPLAQLDGDVNDEVVVDAMSNLPPMEIRIAVGKQLIEVAMLPDAIRVLSSIMWECDFNVEVWYMLAVAYWKQGDVDEARQTLEMTRSVLHNPEGYDGMLEEALIDRLLGELTQDNDADDEDTAMGD